MTPRPSSAFAATIALAALACAQQVPTWSDVHPVEAYLETLPSGAAVQVNGEDLGRTPLSFPVRDAKLAYRIRAAAPGFDTVEVTVEGAKLAEGRLDLVLRPEGFGTQRALSLSEPVGLSQAAATLVKARRPREALSYIEASLAAGDTALAHRVAGEAYRQLGNRNRAVQEFSLYLTMQPGTPDRGAIEKAIEETRRDLTIPGLKAD